PRRVVGEHDRHLARRPADAALRGARADRLHLLHGAVAQLPRRRRARPLRRAGERDMSLLRRHRSSADRFADAPLDGPLLDVNEVKTYFKTERGLVHAVDGVSLTLERGKTLG